MQALVSLEAALQLLPGDHSAGIISPLHDAVLRSTGDESTSGHDKVTSSHAPTFPCLPQLGHFSGSIRLSVPAAEGF